MNEHVYARPEMQEWFKQLREQAKEAVETFFLHGMTPVQGDVVQFYCHQYALEAAYGGDQSLFDEEGNKAGENESRDYPRYTLYYSMYSETSRRLVQEVMHW